MQQTSSALITTLFAVVWFISALCGFFHLGKRSPCTVIAAVFKTEPLGRRPTHEGSVKSYREYTQARLYRPADYNNSMQGSKSTDIIITGPHTPPLDASTQRGCNDRAGGVMQVQSRRRCRANLQQWPHTNVQSSCCKPVPSYHKKPTCHLYARVWGVHARSSEKIFPFTVSFCS